ncbi:MAG: UvrD-helicase domain-containing protein, partial [Propionibacterium freudenreichii]
MEHELELEQRHVDHVYERLEAAMAEARNVEAESRARFTSDRADWLREEDSTALFERDAFAYQASRRLAILDEEHEGLVFGRLDLLLDKETRYIGRLGVRDEDYEPLVIDWRAPAAEAFYRATPNNPMGVVRRRVLRCRDDKVIGIEDDLLDTEADTDLVVIGEGALMAALGRARGQHMRSIVATIQAEQDEAIRAPYQGVTTIAGGPGTGKTVVALHRAAYLLYTHRKRLERGGVLVVGPSD